VILLALLITYAGFQDDKTVNPESINLVQLHTKTSPSYVNDHSDYLNSSIIEPKDGIINLRKDIKSIRTNSNPFRKNISKKRTPDRIIISIGGIIEHDDPANNCVIINDTPFSINDSVSGFLITEILHEHIILKFEKNTIIVPIQEVPISINVEQEI